MGDTPEDPTELNTETLTMEKPAVVAVTEEYNDDSEKFEHQGGGTPDASKTPTLGGAGGFNVLAYGMGAKVTGKGGGGTGLGLGTSAGSGGNGSGFGGRGSGYRKARLASGGGTKAGELAVAGALHWLMRHQCYEGNWSFDKYKPQCKDASCSGTGSAQADAGATGMALLCYLAAGQTHKTKGPYRMNIEKGLVWLVRHQEKRRLSRQGLHLAHVLPRPGHHRLVRGLRHQRRPQRGHRRAGRRELHHRRPEQERLRLAL